MAAVERAEHFRGEVSVCNLGIGGNRLLYGATPASRGMYGHAGIERYRYDTPNTRRKKSGSSRPKDKSVPNNPKIAPDAPTERYGDRR